MVVQSILKIPRILFTVLTPRKHSKRALIVDDCSMTRHLMREVVEKEGFECEEAANAFEAAKWFEDHEADLVTTDIHQGWRMEENGEWIPRPTGLELVEALANRKNRKPPIMIVASGSIYFDPTYSERARKAGAKGLFCKPWDRKEFLTVIRDAFNLKQDFVETQTE